MTGQRPNTIANMKKKLPVKVIRTDSELACPMLDAALPELVDNYQLLAGGVDQQQLLDTAIDADLILMCYTPIQRPLIESASKLKGIIKYGVGIDAIDIEAAIEHRVPVCNVPAYAEQTVAEGAFTLLLALAKKLIPVDREMHRNGWLWPQPAWLANDIAGATIGLIGFGRIGRCMANMAGNGFGAKVIAYDPAVSRASMAAAGATKIDQLTHLLTQSDYLSLHCVLNKETYHLLGPAEFDSIKPGACLINVSRGDLIDERALLKALDNGTLAAAALDVFSREPLQLNGHPLSALYRQANVILSPHLTFYTHQAMQRLETETLQRCREVFDHQPLTVKSTDPRLLKQSVGVQFANATESATRE